VIIEPVTRVNRKPQRLSTLRGGAHAL
jgi:hypothetical protein